jgi:hypothetical protein
MKIEGPWLEKDFQEFVVFLAAFSLLAINLNNVNIITIISIDLIFGNKMTHGHRQGSGL